MKLRTWRVDQRLRLEDTYPRFGMTLNRQANIERGLIWPSPIEIAVIERKTGGAVTLQDHYDTWITAHPSAINDAWAAVAAVG